MSVGSCASALDGVNARALAAIEAVEDMRQFLRRNAYAFVADHQLTVAVRRRHRHRDLAVRGRVLGRIVEQDCNGLLEALSIDIDVNWCRGNFRRDCDAFAASQNLTVPDRLHRNILEL